MNMKTRMDAMSQPMSELPHYSTGLVHLARAYDRAALAVAASNWHLAELQEDHDFFVDGDDSLSDYAQVRVRLLQDQLPAMLAAVEAMIAMESEPWFEVRLDGPHGLVMPPVVKERLAAWGGYDKSFSVPYGVDVLPHVSKHLGEHYVIVFDTDAFLLPRSFPKSFIEIWWRRNFFGTFGDHPHYYEMALQENPAYGWDCYGHER